MRTLFELPDQYNIDLLTEELVALPYVGDVNEVKVDEKIFSHGIAIGIYHEENLVDREIEEVELVISNHDSLGKSSAEQKQEALTNATALLRTKLTASTWTPLTDEEVDILLQ